MPIDRNGRVRNTNGHRNSHIPGAYEHALRRICKRDADKSMRDILECDKPSEWEGWEEERAEKVAALIAERMGKPLQASSTDLPHGLPSPLDNGGRRSFLITPEDEIRLVPRRTII